MTRFIKAYNEGAVTVFEFAVTGWSPKGSRLRAQTRLARMVPDSLFAIEDVSVYKLGNTGGAIGDVLQEYRVVITVSDQGGLRDKLNIDDVITSAQELL